MKEGISKKALIGIMAKYPGNGEVKTRLTPPLTGSEAAGLYESILLDTIDTLDRIYFTRALYFHPPGKKDYFEQITGPGWRLIPQSGKNLGQRLKNVFTELKGYDHPVVIIGSDSPALPMEHIIGAVLLLQEGNDMVLGPAEDGGFYLIGARDVSTLDLDYIFSGIRWSTSHALEDIQKNIECTAGTLAFAETWFDLDTGDDLKQTICWFREHAGYGYTNTRRYLGEITGN